MIRTVLVATDGTPAALGALRFARFLESEEGCRVHVLGVVEPVPVFDAGFMVAVPEMELYESRQDALAHEIRGQLDAVAGQGRHWPVTVRAGIPGQKIVQHAQGLGAETIVLGLGRHRPVDRVFGTETALQVLRVSHLPVLAVPEDLERLPSSALLGVDFSLFSLRAARAAMGLLRKPWEMHLVHVLSGMEFLPTLSEDWRVDYEAEVRQRLDEMAGELERPPGCELHLHVLEGDPSHELLAFQEGRGVELLAAGSHGHSFVGRLLMGSVSTRLIRTSEVAVLVVPPPQQPEEVSVDHEAEGGRAIWDRELDAFTKANAGRRTTLELKDPEMGEQQCGRGFPLWGVDYDPRKDRINIMLGRSGTVEGHLTHSLPSPREISVIKGADGRAEALYIQLPRGSATLRIHRD